MMKCRTQPSPAKIHSIENSPLVIPDESLGEQLHILIRADGPTSWERIIVVALVALAHFAGILAYWAQPEMPRILVNEMSISFANMQMQQADVIPQPKPKPKFKPRDPDPVPPEEPAVKEEVAQPVQPETGCDAAFPGGAGCRAGLQGRLPEQSAPALSHGGAAHGLPRQGGAECRGAG